MTWQLARAMLDVPLKPVDVPGLSGRQVGRSPQRVTLLALGLRAGSDGRAWPSVAQLVEDTGLSERAVQYTLRALVIVGLLAVDCRPGRAHVLCITLPGVQPVHPQGVQPVHPGVQPRTKRGATSAPRRRKEEEKEVRGPRDGESWGEYRERGGR